MINERDKDRTCIACGKIYIPEGLLKINYKRDCECDYNSLVNKYIISKQKDPLLKQRISHELIIRHPLVYSISERLNQKKKVHYQFGNNNK